MSVGLGPLPLPSARFTYTVCAPIQPPANPALADDEAAVQAFHTLVWRTCQAELDQAVAKWRRERRDV